MPTERATAAGALILDSNVPTISVWLKLIAEISPSVKPRSTGITYTGTDNRNLEVPSGLDNFTIEAYTPGSKGVILDGEEGNYYGIHIQSGLSANTVIRDLTLTGFWWNGNQDAAGIAVDESECTIENCRFSNCKQSNAVGGVGGAIGAAGASATLTINGCAIDNCHRTDATVGKGGGIGAYQLAVIAISNTIITNCSAGLWGGGLYTDVDVLTFDNCVIDNCSATGDGGGIYAGVFDQIDAFNCLISNCTTDDDGGGVYLTASGSTLRSCTIVGNYAADDGGGVFASAGCSFLDCHVRGNTAGDQGWDLLLNGNVAANYSNIRPQAAPFVQGTGTLTRTNCLDVNGDFDNQSPPDWRSYYLNQSISALIDAGSDTAANIGLDDRTTAAGGTLDSGTVDIGFHYAAGAPSGTYIPAMSQVI